MGNHLKFQVVASALVVIKDLITTPNQTNYSSKRKREFIKDDIYKDFEIRVNIYIYITCIIYLYIYMYAYVLIT